MSKELPSWYLTAYKYLVILVFFLIALGGSVRIMKAGLACPDWPLCFGDVIPDFHPQVYFEFIHRVVAGSVALITLFLQVILWRSNSPHSLKWLGGIAVALLLAQVVFGGLTVILLLKAGVVATHLLLGTAFFGSLLWIYLSLRARDGKPQMIPGWLYLQSLLMSAAVYGQIFLGGLVASNNASLVCIDFPTCHGEWFPTFSGIIGLQVIHRLGAYTIFIMALGNWLIVRKFVGKTPAKRLSELLFLGVCGQATLGIANVLLLTPPLIAVSHLALGVAVFSLTIRQLHFMTHAASTFESPVVLPDGPFERLRV